MTLKKFDLAKNLGLKISSQMKSAGVPNRFGAGSTPVLDKREQRKRDAAAGLVPFACKLPSTLVKRLHERVAQHEGGLNGLVAELIEKGLQAEAPAAAAASAAGSPAQAEKVPKARKTAKAKSEAAGKADEAEAPTQRTKPSTGA